MNSFIAVDVETANQQPSSICSIGAVKVIDGRIVDRKYSLVHPEPDYYSYVCQRVHGLGDADTFDAPSFGAVWNEWQPWLDGFRLIAHNAAFDRHCIKSACRIYGLPEPYDWGCTLMAARRKIPRGVLHSKSLDSLCEFFGIRLEKHHNALDDAEACARLAIILVDL